VISKSQLKRMKVQNRGEAMTDKVEVIFKDEDELDDGRPIGPVKVFRNDELVWASDDWLTLTQARKVAKQYRVELERV